MDHQWRGPDAGLIWCWERGRQKAVEDPALAVMARKEVLVPLAFKGGVDKDNIPKSNKKNGHIFYLAQWQGLAGKDLDIDTDWSYCQEWCLGD